MFENFIFFFVFIGWECMVVFVKFLSFVEGVLMIVGINIGVGVFFIVYVLSKVGFLLLLFWLVLVGSLMMVIMFYVVEFMLCICKYLQFSGLLKCYVGGFGVLMMFFFVCVNSVGVLMVYMIGSGKLLYFLFGILLVLGSVLFFVLVVGVFYLGLKVIGCGEKFISIGMVVMILVLVIVMLLKDIICVGYLFDGNWLYMVLVFNVVVFCFLVQYIVLEMVWGFVDKLEKLFKVIMVGMVLIFILLVLVLLLVILFNGFDNILDVVIIFWGWVFGEWVFFLVNLFVLCVMLIFYWGLGGSFLINIFDQFCLGNDEQFVWCLMVLLVVVILLFVLVYSGMVFFVNVFYFVGVFSGVILLIMLILMFKGVCQCGDLILGWICLVWMIYLFI